MICGGWRAGSESWCGDWKERALSHQFVRKNYQSTQVCDQCDAVKPFARTPPHLLGLIYTDFRLDAPWTRTIQTHEQYVQSAPVDKLTPWLEVPGFILSRVRWDSAHTILLGTGKDLASSFLYDMEHCLKWQFFLHQLYQLLKSGSVLFATLGEWRSSNGHLHGPHSKLAMLAGNRFGTF